MAAATNQEVLMASNDNQVVLMTTRDGTRETLFPGVMSKWNSHDWCLNLCFDRRSGPKSNRVLTQNAKKKNMTNKHFEKKYHETTIWRNVMPGAMLAEVEA